jgi:hypothetical protein
MEARVLPDLNVFTCQAFLAPHPNGGPRAARLSHASQEKPVCKSVASVVAFFCDDTTLEVNPAHFLRDPTHFSDGV